MAGETEPSRIVRRLDSKGVNGHNGSVQMWPKSSDLGSCRREATTDIANDNGQSNRKSILYWPGPELAAIRIDEFKGHQIDHIDDAIMKKGDIGGFSGGIFTKTGGAVAVNLYTNPKEDASIGIRHIPMMMLLGVETIRYKELLKKYPPQIKVQF